MQGILLHVIVSMLVHQQQHPKPFWLACQAGLYVAFQISWVLQFDDM
jgi:hypothetical protein